MVSSRGARWRSGPAFSYSYCGLPCVVSPHLVTAPHLTTAPPFRLGDIGMPCPLLVPGSVPGHSGSVSRHRPLVGLF
jgi:hypothetical protein